MLWRRLVHLLTEPSPLITEPGRRRRARLLSTILLPCFPLIIVVSVIAQLFNPTVTAWPTIIALLMAVAAYILSRTRFHEIAAWVTMATATAAPISGAQVDPTALFFVAMSVFISGILLSVRITLTVAAICMALLAMMPLTLGIPPDEVSNPMILVVIVGFFSVMAAYIARKDHEQIEDQNLELRNARDDAIEASRVKSAFVANMSHELRTPLNAIIGLMQLLEEDRLEDLEDSAIAADDSTLEQYGKVLLSAKHLLELINDVLDISKIEAGKMELDITSVALKEIIETLEVEMRLQAQHRNLDLIIDVGELRVHADNLRLKQVLLNLVGNAIKFTPSGGKVNVRAEANDGKVRIIVDDTGIGIPAEQLGAIFEKFTQVDGTTTRSEGGTGLGLAITRELVELQDGAIQVQSDLGKGTRFSFELRQAAESSGRELPPMDVLVVEDDLMDQARVVQLLRDEGHSVHAVVSAEAAQEVLARALPSVIVLDLDLPGKSGSSLLLDLAASKRTAQVPVVVLSSMSVDQDSGSVPGVEAVLRKGASDLTQLGESVRTLLRPSGV